MLHPNQDQVLRDLAHSIARAIETLGRTCTSRLLARIAFGLVDDPKVEKPTVQRSQTHLASEHSSNNHERWKTRRHVGRTQRILNNSRRPPDRP